MSEGHQDSASTPPSPASSSGPALSAPARADDGWERDLIGELARTALVEQRRSRRWGIFFKFAMVAYVSAALVIYIPADILGDGLEEPHTALVDVKGTIAAGGDASADRVATGLRAAFEHEQTKAVIVRINSPGGSPVQASYINTEMRRLREKYPEIPLYAVITDMCASGGYYVAAGADKIYANGASLVGSIGVVLNGFGFVDAMRSFGVERRLYTAGEHKGFLDPFSPERPAEVEHLQGVLGEVHEQFIEVVRSGRGDRLADSPELYSGLVWTGKRGIELGLVDALGSTGSVARDVVGVENIVDFTARPGLLERMASRFGASFGASAVGAVVHGAQLN
jgi:protease IV